MPTKSVRDMSKFERLRNSLQARVFNAILLLATLIGIAALVVGLGLYTWTLSRQYFREGFGIAKSAAAAVNDVVDVSHMCRTVMKAYREMDDEVRQQTGTDEYRHRVAFMMETIDYQKLQRVLTEFQEAGNAADVYVGMYDKNTNALVYVCDPDTSEETGLFPTEWEAVDAKEYEKFLNWDGTGELYDVSKTERYGWLCTAGYPIRDNRGAICGFMLADVTLADVIRGAKVFVLQFAAVVAITTLILSVIMSRRMKTGLIDPLNKIGEAARSYVKDRREGNAVFNHFVDLDIHTGDEIENLSLIMADMEVGLREYESSLTKVTADRERIVTELELAKRIQSEMLPYGYPAFPDCNEFDIYATMDAARQVGGDFYDFFLVDEDHLAMAIADVSGKGIPAALYMMASKIILANFAKLGKAPAEILESMNTSICSRNPEEMFVTVWIGILEISTGKVVAANAGHEYPAVCRAGGKFELIKDKHGFVVGGMDGVKYTNYEWQLEPGDKIFVYTDGVPEATDEEKKMFGTERMLDALNIDPAGDPVATLKGVKKEVLAFIGNADQFDDLTMLCMEYKGTTENK